MHFLNLALVASCFLAQSNGLDLAAWTRGASQHPLEKPDRPDSRTIRAKLQSSEVIPDVLDDFHPAFLPVAHYTTLDDLVYLGNPLKPRAVSRRPDMIKIFPLAPSKTLSPDLTYTLVLSDPDATSRADPIYSQMCHWILTNITFPGSAAHVEEVESSTSIELPALDAEDAENKFGYVELETYFPPSPPPKTGFHRYVFALLASESGAGASSLVRPRERRHWGYGKEGAGIREWAADNGLTVLGANFFYVRNRLQ